MTKFTKIAAGALAALTITVGALATSSTEAHAWGKKGWGPGIGFGIAAGVIGAAAFAATAPRYYGCPAAASSTATTRGATTAAPAGSATSTKLLRPSRPMHASTRRESWRVVTFSFTPCSARNVCASEHAPWHDNENRVAQSSAFTCTQKRSQPPMNRIARAGDY